VRHVNWRLFRSFALIDSCKHFNRRQCGFNAKVSCNCSFETPGRTEFNLEKNQVPYSSAADSLEDESWGVSFCIRAKTK
jgi:hypothetical protein